MSITSQKSDSWSLRYYHWQQQQLRPYALRFSLMHAPEPATLASDFWSQPWTFSFYLACDAFRRHRLTYRWQLPTWDHRLFGRVCAFKWLRGYSALSMLSDLQDWIPLLQALSDRNQSPWIEWRQNLLIASYHLPLETLSLQRRKSSQ